jgi:hypothetical protein
VQIAGVFSGGVEACIFGNFRSNSRSVRHGMMSTAVLGDICHDLDDGFPLALLLFLLQVYMFLSFCYCIFPVVFNLLVRTFSGSFECVDIRDL